MTPKLPRNTSGSVWALSDVLMCFLVIVMVLVSAHKKDDGQVEAKGEYEITATWSVENGNGSDVDLWGVHDSEPPVFYNQTQQGLMNLDLDCLGSPNDHVTMPDGSVIKQKVCTETITIRGYVPGRYDFAVHMFRMEAPTLVTVVVKKINPRVETLKTVVVELVKNKQSKNVFSMTMDAAGTPTEVDVPLEPITDRYYEQKSDQ